MEKQYNNTNRGRLFKNDRKQKETHPDYTGDININGTDYWLSAWKKTSKAGKPFLSISIGNPKETKNAEMQAAGQKLKAQQVQEVKQHIQSVEEDAISLEDVPF